MWKLNENIVWRNKNELVVVLNTQSGHYYTLNEVAADLWLGLFEAHQSLEEVVAGVSAKYANAPSSEQGIADCQEVLQYWAAENLITPVCA